MDLNEVRSKYLQFFKARGHAIIPSSSLVPENDPTTLFTGSGMQPLVPYLLGKNHPAGAQLANSQKCFRAMDIEEVGDNRHTTFFEMLGNWSLGDYFKKEQLRWFFEFLTDEIGLDPKKLYVTAFSGDERNGLPKDSESADIWQKLFAEKNIEAKTVDIGSEAEGYEKGMQGGRIFFYDATKNWWSRAGVPEHMPPGEPGGPDSEVFYCFEQIEHDKKFGEHCHPNCDCGRFLEIGNSVFMQYIKNENGSFGLLPKKNVDFGGGLERIGMAANNTADMFIVNHREIIVQLESLSGKKYGHEDGPQEHTKAFRVIADHIKAATFLIADGARPGNVERGYVVRRLLRRAVRYADMLGVPENKFADLSQSIVREYKEAYPELAKSTDYIHQTIDQEEKRFRETLQSGLKILDNKLAAQIRRVGEPSPYQVNKGEGVPYIPDGRWMFNFFQEHGFPFELLIEELLVRNNILEGDVPRLKEQFDEEMEKHRKESRAGASQRFAGGLADHAEKTIRLHTAHHLLLRALQIVLGPDVKQRGSNITQERLRIDFLYPQKMTPEQLAEVERIVNEKIAEDLPVVRSELSREEAERLGAEHEFGQKYPERVSVYSVGPKEATEVDPKFGQQFSIEFCGGPHVSHTSELASEGKHFKIQKEEAVSAGIRRIRAVLE